LHSRPKSPAIAKPTFDLTGLHSLSGAFPGLDQVSHYGVLRCEERKGYITANNSSIRRSPLLKTKASSPFEPYLKGSTFSFAKHAAAKTKHTANPPPRSGARSTEARTHAQRPETARSTRSPVKRPRARTTPTTGASHKAPSSTSAAVAPTKQWRAQTARRHR